VLILSPFILALVIACNVAIDAMLGI
jgi:hypothetical protein